jgi:anthranilate synthase component 1
MAIHTRNLVVDGLTPVGAYAVLREDAGDGSFLLESVERGERWGRYSILGYRPGRVIDLYAEPDKEPFSELARLTSGEATQANEVAVRFARAHVGVLNYDIVHYATKVDPWPSTGAPLARLVGDATVIVFDNLTHTAQIAAHSQEALERAVVDLARARALAPMALPDRASLPSEISLSSSDEAFSASVEACKEHIRAGDAFQIVIARTFSVPRKNASPFAVYRALRVLSPAPYMYLLELPARGPAPPTAIAGASPETLVRVREGIVTLRPIAGTRRRGATAEEDAALAEEMLSDPKERAEHVMLIDLARNDVGRVSQPGTVRVPINMAVDRFSHVMHIVSEVEGTLKPELGPWDVVRATFPAGTLSGAPKVRAMQIIRELEPRARGTYGGAVGYVTADGDLDLAIAIRTVVLQDGCFQVTAGAGIVADSQPAAECEETRNKARAALAAIAHAELVSQ